MIAKNYYIFKNGRLARRDNNLCLKPINENKENDQVSDFQRPIFIPVENVEDIYCFGENVVNSKLFHFLLKKMYVCIFSTTMEIMLVVLYPKILFLAVACN